MEDLALINLSAIRDNPLPGSAGILPAVKAGETPALPDAAETLIKAEDVDATGMVYLTDKPLYQDVRKKGFNTESGKIEIISQELEKQGIPSLMPYEPPGADEANARKRPVDQ